MRRRSRRRLLREAELRQGSAPESRCCVAPCCGSCGAPCCALRGGGTTPTRTPGAWNARRCRRRLSHHRPCSAWGKRLCRRCRCHRPRERTSCRVLNAGPLSLPRLRSGKVWRVIWGELLSVRAGGGVSLCSFLGITSAINAGRKVQIPLSFRWLRACMYKDVHCVLKVYDIEACRFVVSARRASKLSNVAAETTPTAIHNNSIDINSKQSSRS